MKLLNKILSPFCSRPVLTLLTQMDAYPEDFYLDSSYEASRIIDYGAFNPIEYVILKIKLRRIRKLEMHKRIYNYSLSPHQEEFWFANKRKNDGRSK